LSGVANFNFGCSFTGSGSGSFFFTISAHLLGFFVTETAAAAGGAFPTG
jgi:hypothetical protein